MISYEDWCKHKWLAVYGASVALQVRDRIDEGRGPPDNEAMVGIKEEARAVADLDAEGDPK